MAAQYELPYYIQQQIFDDAHDSSEDAAHAVEMAVVKFLDQIDAHRSVGFYLSERGKIILAGPRGYIRQIRLSLPAR